MFKHENIICLFLVILLLFLTLSSVSALEDNMTGGLALENGTVMEIDDGPILDKNDEDAYGAKDDGSYVDASQAYDYVNEFRQEYGVWIYTSDTEVTYFNTNEYNRIKPLERDIALEEVAKIRAKEIVQLFSHERPDGTSCFEIYPDYGAGENIADGFLSAYDAVDVWKEDFAYFEYQGHRRNMLNPYFDTIGIAGFKVGGRSYWVQSFGIKHFPSDDFENVTPADNSKGTFEDLKNLIENGADVRLDRDYNFNNDSGLIGGIIVKRAMTIDGQGHSIDARCLAQIFNVTADNVVLKNICFMNANMERCAVSLTGNNVSIINCSFIANNGYYGGAISIYDADACIMDCSFSNNFAAEGGAVYANNSAVSISHSRFIGNGAVLGGGAMYSNNCSESIEDCTFSGNCAFFIGGAVCLNGCRDIISGCEFNGNSALNHGGALYANRSSNSIVKCNFRKNYMPDKEVNEGQGSAICEHDCTGEIKSCRFDANNMSRLGTAYLYGGDVDVVNCSFTNNYAEFCGILYLQESRFEVIDSTFTKNTPYEAGGIFIDGGYLKVRNCSFISNDVEYLGGAISSHDADIFVYDSIFLNNRAGQMGNSIACDNGKMYIEGSSFLNSRGRDYSYEIFSWKDKITVVESVCVINYGPVAVMPFTGTSSIKNSNIIRGSIANGPIIVSGNAKVTYKAGSTYQVTLVNSDGKFVEGGKIVITVNGKSTTLKTNARGIAKFKVTQAPGKYKISIKSSSKKIKKTLTVKHLLTLKSVQVKKSAKKLVLQASLGKIGGKYIKNAKITFKFNGKKYFAKTNAKGVAKVTVKSAILKKLKTGKKIIYQATYLKDTVKKTAKVKR